MADTTKSTEVSIQFSNIETAVAEAKQDEDKFSIQGNAAAGKRLRAHMQDIIEAAKAVRKEVQEQKNRNKAAKAK